ncbi:MAG: PepSY domain-containing protein [Phycisphaerae bacterium]|nr:PepSY domain-containing protein [Gemmatimonadaceae bacterium]
MNADVPGAPRSVSVSRVAFYSHLWFGVLFTVVLTVIAISGILLNHKRGLGLMPDVPHEPTAALAASLSIDSLARIALASAATIPGLLEEAGGNDPLKAIDRMDARPRNGFVKVRLRDRAATEFTVDLASGKVLHTGKRGDVFLEKLHSGETFGDGWILLSDAGAIALLITLVSGYWLWLAPKWRSTQRNTSHASTGGEAR